MALALLGACLTMAACGSGDGDSSASSAEAALAKLEREEKLGSEVTSYIAFEAHWTKRFRYTADTTSGEAGTVQIGFTNPQDFRHNIALEDSGGKTVARTETIGEGTTSTIARLKPGTYRYYCSLPGHRAAGMEGVLTLERPQS